MNRRMVNLARVARAEFRSAKPLDRGLERAPTAQWSGLIRVASTLSVASLSPVDAAQSHFRGPATIRHPANHFPRPCALC